MSIGELSDGEFLAAVEAATHPGEAFGHEAHLRLGWLCLRAHGFEAGVARTPGLIVQDATALGGPGEDHQTGARAGGGGGWGAPRGGAGGARNPREKRDGWHTGAVPGAGRGGGQGRAPAAFRVHGGQDRLTRRVVR